MSQGTNITYLTPLMFLFCKYSCHKSCKRLQNAGYFLPAASFSAKL